MMRSDFAAIAKWVEPGSQVLDVGCGDGRQIGGLHRRNLRRRHRRQLGGRQTADLGRAQAHHLRGCHRRDLRSGHIDQLSGCDDG